MIRACAPVIHHLQCPRIIGKTISKELQVAILGDDDNVLQTNTKFMGNVNAGLHAKSHSWLQLDMCIALIHLSWSRHVG